MRIVGINGTDIEATSVGEAAAIDMVLVIDTSSSMAYDTVDYNTIINGKKQDNDPADTTDPVNLPGDNPEGMQPPPSFEQWKVRTPGRDY